MPPPLRPVRDPRAARARRRALAGLGLIALLLTACAGWRPLKVPMDTVVDLAPCAAPGGARPATLLVLLPGAYDTPADFVREGFVAAVRQRGLAVDVTLVDAHVGYYTGGTLIERLRTDVIAPARARGYREIWLAGISIGGFGSLIYAESHPDEVAGVIALAPYLGPRNIVAEVRTAGGVRAWRAPEPLPPEDVDRRLWRWLQGYGDPAARATHPPLYLGYGVDDRFAPGHATLAGALPEARVFTAPGGHDWPAWRTLWERLLDSVPIGPGGCPQPARS